MDANYMMLDATDENWPLLPEVNPSWPLLPPALGHGAEKTKRVSLDATETWMSEDDELEVGDDRGFSSTPDVLRLLPEADNDSPFVSLLWTNEGDHELDKERGHSALGKSFLTDSSSPKHASFSPLNHFLDWSSQEGHPLEITINECRNRDTVLMDDSSRKHGSNASDLLDTMQGEHTTAAPNDNDEVGDSQDSASQLEFDATFPSEPISIHDLMEERRVRLAASMKRSQESRKCFLEGHIETRAALAKVLKEIERSSKQVARHLLQEIVSEDDAKDCHLQPVCTCSTASNIEDKDQQQLVSSMGSR